MQNTAVGLNTKPLKMSDVEEPPTKVVKYEMSQTFTQPEEMDEGQEEWLSEGLLTDDDFNPDQSANDQDPDRTRSDLDSQGVPEETMEDSVPEEAQGEVPQEDVMQEENPQEAQLDSSGNNETAPVVTQENTDSTGLQPASKLEDNKIEQTLTSMDAQPGDELDAFLVRSEGEKTKDDAVESDGNDTDDLLRMLEDDDKTKKSKVTKPSHPQKEEKLKAKQASEASQDQSSDGGDDDFVFERSSVKTVQVAKRAMASRKFPATKAQPESSDDDTSSEDAETVRKMFSSRSVRVRNVVRVGAAATKKPAATSTPLPGRQNHTNKSLLTTQARRSVLKTNVGKVERKPQPKPVEHEEIINEEEFLEEDDFDLREDFAEESDQEVDKRGQRQPIMRPERMDEDMLSDPDSHSDDGSLYDDMPSSESDDMDEWFTLDIRSERAGDYLPLLGNKAYDLLIQEKARVSGRLTSLRTSLAALTNSGQQQAERLRRATAALAEVDDVLKAA